MSDTRIREETVRAWRIVDAGGSLHTAAIDGTVMRPSYETMRLSYE